LTQLKVDVGDLMPLIEQGKLRAIRIGNKIRIPEAEVEKLLVTSAAGPGLAGSSWSVSFAGDRDPARQFAVGSHPDGTGKVQGRRLNRRRC
jgi:excisionase family DNA binding protein